MTELPPGCVYSDHLILSPDEAVEAIAHHLRLATLFWLSFSEDTEAIRAEVLRLVESRAGILGKEDPSYLGAAAWLTAVIEDDKASREKYP